MSSKLLRAIVSPTPFDRSDQPPPGLLAALDPHPRDSHYASCANSAGKHRCVYCTGADVRRHVSRIVRRDHGDQSPFQWHLLTPQAWKVHRMS